MKELWKLLLTAPAPSVPKRKLGWLPIGSIVELEGKQYRFVKADPYSFTAELERTNEKVTVSLDTNVGFVFPPYH